MLICLHVYMNFVQVVSHTTSYGIRLNANCHFETNVMTVPPLLASIETGSLLANLQCIFFVPLKGTTETSHNTTFGEYSILAKVKLKLEETKLCEICGQDAAEQDKNNLSS